jgi:hypothetical protein
LRAMPILEGLTFWLASILSVPEKSRDSLFTLLTEVTLRYKID